MLFFDTNALLEEGQSNLLANSPFCISNMTLKELESIKMSSTKDLDTKFKARKLVRFLAEHQQAYRVVCLSDKVFKESMTTNPILSENNNDSRIVAAAMLAAETNPIEFITRDLSCLTIAHACGLEVRYQVDESVENYDGFKFLKCKSDAEMAFFYNNTSGNDYDLLTGEYLFVQDESDKIVDTYTFKDGRLTRLPSYYTFESHLLGKLKPKDPYQLCLMDSLTHNDLTVVEGPAGSGKSLISLSYLFQELEKGRIDKIIIFCNPVPTRGAAKLGSTKGIRLK